MKLYEIASEIERFWAAVEEGEIPPEAIADTWDGLEYDFDSKVDNLACVYKNHEAEAKAIQEEEKKLAARRKALENQAQRVREYLLEQLQRVGKQKVETGRNVVSLRATPASVVVSDAQALYEKRPDLFRVKEPEADKAGIREELKAGKELPGCALVQGLGVQIR